jgi:hypothetical protein
MNGPAEQAGKVASSAIDALKSVPVFLMLLLFQVLIVVGTLWALHERNDQFERQFEILMKQCGPKA